MVYPVKLVALWHDWLASKGWQVDWDFQIWIRCDAPFVLISAGALTNLSMHKAVHTYMTLEHIRKEATTTHGTFEEFDFHLIVSDDYLLGGATEAEMFEFFMTHLDPTEVMGVAVLLSRMPPELRKIYDKVVNCVT